MPASPPAHVGLVGREEVVKAAADAAAKGVVSMVGPPGAGTSAAAWAAAQRLVSTGRAGTGVWLRLDATTDVHDAVRALGLGVRALLSGDEVSVQEALRPGPPHVVVLDDGDLAPEAVRHLTSLSPREVWIVTGRRSVIGRQVEVPPLPDHLLARLLPTGVDPAPYLGLPWLASLPVPPSSDDPWAGVDQASDHPAVPLPMGLPDPALPPPLGLDVPGRAVPHRALREALGMVPAPTAEALTGALRALAPEVSALAVGFPEHSTHEDLLLFQAAARSARSPLDAARAGSAAARLLQRHFQTSQALSLVRDVLDRPDVGEDDMALGLLRWAEADALLSQGAEVQALAEHGTAVAALSRAGAPALVLLLARRCAEEWSARGRWETARDWLGLAREKLVAIPDPVSLADTLRLSAEMSMRRGEGVRATALFDEAVETLLRTPGGESLLAAIRVGQAALALAAGDSPRADALLSEAERMGTSSDLVLATVAHRRAEAAARAGEVDEALEHNTEAEVRFRRQGSTRGLIQSTRLRGDLAALRGNRLNAASAYHTAVTLCLRSRNLELLGPVLRRALVLEGEGRSGDHVVALQEALDMARSIARS